MESNLCWEWTKWETRSPWLRWGYNTSKLMPGLRFWASTKFWVLLLNNLTVVKILSLNTIDPQPPPSCIYKIQGWELFYQSRLSNTVRRKTSIYELGHDRTGQLIRLGLSDHLSDQVRAKVMCCKSLTTVLPAQWLLNHQGSILAPYGLPHAANRWSHLGMSYPSAEVQLVYPTAPASLFKGLVWFGFFV